MNTKQMFIRSVASLAFTKLALIAFLCANSYAQDSRQIKPLHESDAWFLKSIALNAPIQDYTMGDFNGDGQIDLAVLGKNRRNIELYFSREPFEYIRRKTIRFRNPILDLEAVDFNQDKVEDLLLLFEKNHTLASYKVKTSGVLSLKGYIVTKQPGQSIRVLSQEDQKQVLVLCKERGVERYLLQKRGWIEFKEHMFPDTPFEDIRPMRHGCDEQIQPGALCLGKTRHQFVMIQGDENNQLESNLYEMQDFETPYLLEELNENILSELIVGEQTSKTSKQGRLKIKYDFGIETGRQDRLFYEGLLPDKLFAAALSKAQSKDLMMLWHKQNKVRLMQDAFALNSAQYLDFGLPQSAKMIKVCRVDQDNFSDIVGISGDERHLFMLTQKGFSDEEKKREAKNPFSLVKHLVASEPADLAVFRSSDNTYCAIAHKKSTKISFLERTKQKTTIRQIDVGFSASQVRFLDKRHVLCYNTRDKILKLISFRTGYKSCMLSSQTLIGIDFYHKGLLTRNRLSYSLTFIDRGNENVQPRTVHIQIKPGYKNPFKTLLPKELPLEVLKSNITMGQYGFYVQNAKTGKMTYLGIQESKSYGFRHSINNKPLGSHGFKDMRLLRAGDFDFDGKDDILFLAEGTLWGFMSFEKQFKKSALPIDQPLNHVRINLYSDNQQESVLGFHQKKSSGTLQTWLFDARGFKPKPLVAFSAPMIDRAVYLENKEGNELFFLNPDTNSLDILTLNN